MRIATIALCLCALAAAGCHVSAEGGVFSCNTDADCAGHGGTTKCVNNLCVAGGSCQAPQALCGSSCVDTQSDRENCGACGTRCDGVCASGRCVAAEGAAPQPVLDSPSPTSSPLVAFHLASCARIAQVAVTLERVAPPADASLWVPCSTSPVSFKLPADGAHALYVWSKSELGTVVADPAVLAVRLDRAGPFASVAGLTDGQTWGSESLMPLQLTVSDASGIALAQVEFSYDNGASWGSTTSVVDVNSGTYPQNLVLSARTGTALARVRTQDKLGNTAFTSLGKITLVACNPAQVPFGGGTGQPGRPYRICSTAQLQAAAAQINADFALYADLDVSAINNLSLPTKSAGAFDGRGFTISGYHLDKPSNGAIQYGAALFQRITGTAALHDLNVRAGNVSGHDYRQVAALVGQIGTGGVVRNCSVQIDGVISGVGAVGGLAGRVDGTLADSTVSGAGTVQCEAASYADPNGNTIPGNIGGVAGAIGPTTVSRISSRGVTVRCEASADAGPAGGTAGWIQGGGTLQNATSTSVTVIARNAAGGVLGSANGFATNLTAVSPLVFCGAGARQYIGMGGAIGALWLDRSVTPNAAGSASDVATFGGSVSCAGSHNLGGIVGFMDETTQLARATNERTDVLGAGVVGGIAGQVSNASLADLTVKGSPVVSGATRHVGGIAGILWSGSIARAATDAVLVGASNGPMGGIVGTATSVFGRAATLSKCASHVRFAPAARDTNGWQSIGGVSGDVWYDPQGGGPWTVAIADCYSDALLPPLGNGNGAASGVTGYVPNTTGTTSLTNVFAFGNAPDGSCVAQGGSGPITFSGAHFNSDGCTQQSPPAGVAALGTGSFASQSSFPTFDFGATWKLPSGAAHPYLAFEPQAASGAGLPSVTLSAAAQAGAAQAVPVMLTAQAASGITLGSVEVSIDGGLTWQVAGQRFSPANGAPTQIMVALPDTLAPMAILLRGRAVAGNGQPGVSVPRQVTLLPCDAAGTPFGGGQGTAAQPYRLCAPVHFDAVNNNADAHFRLHADVDLSGRSVGLFIRGGSFDGAGHTVSHFAADVDGGASLTYDVGLFRYVGHYQAPFSNPPITVKNLTVQVDHVEAKSAMNVGGLAGHLGPDARLENVHVLVSGPIRGTAQVGALAGFSNIGAQVAGATVNGLVGGVPAGEVGCTMEPQAANFGGALGFFGGTATGVDVVGMKVACAYPNTGPVGGIAGGLWIGATPAPQLTSSRASLVSVRGGSNVGGAVGVASGRLSDVTVKNATVAGARGSVGGLMGNGNEVSASDVLVADSSVTGTDFGAGGIAGTLFASPAPLQRAEARRVAVTGLNHVGGAVGGADGSSLTDVAVTGGGAITGESQVGGVIGWAGQTSTHMLRLRSDAILKGTPQPAGGIVGGYYPMQASSTFAQLASHATIEASSNRAGGLFGDINALDTATVRISDSYFDGILPAGTPLNIVGGVIGGLDSWRMALTVSNVFASTRAPSNNCVLGNLSQSAIAASGVFYLGDLCSGSPVGAGLSTAAMADPSSFPTYDFESTWRPSGGHPALTFEAGSPPVATVSGLPAPAATNQPFSVTVTPAVPGAAFRTASLQASADGVAWTTLGTRTGTTGAFSIASNVLTADGQWQLRLVLVDADGVTTAIALGVVTASACNPAVAPYGGGAGTQASPYLICSVAQLAAVDSNQNSQSHFRLERDLSLGGQPTSITLVTGVFDGNNHRLTHVKPVAGPSMNVGLFRVIGGAGSVTGTVRRLTLQVDGFDASAATNVGGLAGVIVGGGVVDGVTVQLSGDVKGLDAVGALAGAVVGGTVINSKVALAPGVYVAAAVRCAGSSTTWGAAGIAGRVDSSTISGVKVSGVAIQCDRFAGGIAGTVDATSSVTNASTDGIGVTAARLAGGAIGESWGTLANLTVQNTVVTASQVGDAYGGVVGQLRNGGSLSGFMVTSATVNAFMSNGDSNGCNAVGGAVGRIKDGPSTVQDGRMQWTWVQNGNGYGTGGVVGVAEAGLTLSHVVFAGGGNVTSWSTGRALGGLIGVASQPFQLDRTGSDAWLQGPRNVGGLIGEAWITGAGGGSISRSYSRATIDGTATNNGGLVGSYGNTTDPGQALAISDSYTTTAVSGATGGGLFGAASSPNAALTLDRVLIASPAANAGACTWGSAATLPSVTANGFFYDASVCGGLGTGAVGHTTAELAQAATYTAAGYSLPGTWAQAIGARPTLAWEPY